MLSVGETLKRARLEQGLDLSTVAAQTKISAKYLEAIESDDRELLPSGFFYKSFVEQYAKCLSLDTQEIDAQVNRVLSADQPLQLPGFESVVARNVPSITSARRFHTRRSYTSVVTLALVMVGCSGIYAWWRGSRPSLNLKSMIDNVRGLGKPTVAQSKTAIAKAEVNKPSSTSNASSAQPQPAPQQDQRQPGAPKSNDSPDRAVVVPAPLQDSKTSGYKVMLDLMAREATWLSVSSDGKPVFSGILQANQSKSVGGKQFAKMRVGNAAGIDVRLNGRLLGPLGARGQVLLVLFTPDNFQILTTPKEGD